VTGPLPGATAPALAPGVHVLGPLDGSGYRVPPVLARRGDGQVIQLTPLLGAVLRAVDGRRDPQAIADHVAEDHGRRLHPDDVAVLVRDRLRPLGLVTDPGAPAPALRRADPLLGLRGRLPLVSAARTDALTRPFLWLYRPPVVAAVLAAFTAASVWVLLRHGLGTAIDEAVGDPALLLGIVGLILASAAFHELGHATACRYGGARPGVMGAAVYLVWPAFYTDVTDSYRLDRRGRLRVDLGGLYFNAVFTVVTVVTWLLTGTEALLVLVPVQLLQMVRQLVPLVRFDGYHVLADLVGVPDLFARIRPTLARALPGGRRRLGPSPLTRRAEVVVVAWVVAVVPVLVGSLGLLLWNLPAVVGGALRTLRLQAGVLADNLAAGRIAAVALGVVGMATVAFLPASAAYLLSRVASRSGRRWWRLTDGRPVLRAVPAAALVLALLVAGPGLLPSPGPTPTDLAGSVTDGGSAELAAGAVADTGARRPAREPRRQPAPSTSPAEAPAPSEPVAVAEAEPTTVTTVTTEPIVPALDLGAEVRVPVVRPAWPFAFDPPSPPGAGDNQALAVGTVDGATKVAWATSLQWLRDEPMANRNEAWALAECIGCRTVAVAFQVVAAAGEVRTAVPRNLAVAVNEDCESCRTTAVAVQLAVTLDELPPAPVRAQVRRIVARVEGLQGTLRDASPGEIRAALLAAHDEALALLEPYLAEPPEPGEPDERSAEEIDPAVGTVPELGAALDPGSTDVAGDEPSAEVDAEEPAAEPDGSTTDGTDGPDEPVDGTEPADTEVAPTDPTSAGEEPAEDDPVATDPVTDDAVDGSTDATTPGSEDPGVTSST